jgi:thiamine biosynthesis lipoprotein
VNALGTVTHVRPRMGTLLALTLPTDDVEQSRLYARIAFDVARRWERVMSRHDPTSDLSRLNRTAGSTAGLDLPDLARALRAARALSRRLGGAFDPTVGSLLELWRGAARRGQPPSVRHLRRALGSAGASALEITGTRIALPRERTSVDLDGFGKGVALDRVGDALRRARCASALLNFGESSLVAIGHPPRGRWSIALRNPFGGFAGAFTLRDRACSTSAARRRPLRVGGRTLGDAIDPRTGRPIARDAQVTVVAASAAAAEAISTALLVLGRSAIHEVSARMRVDVCWIDRSGVYTTTWFALEQAA